MARSRDEILAEMQPIRLDLIRVAEHLNDDHCIRPEMREMTDPAQMPDHTVRRVGRRYLNVIVGDPVPGRAGDEVATIETIRELIVLFQAATGLCTLKGDCPGVDRLLAMYGNLAAARDVLAEELPPAPAGGGVQEIRPHGLSVEALTGIAGRAG